MNNSPQTYKSLYLIDINSLFFRSYYAISLNMKNEKGLPTNALYGVLKMIQQLDKKKSPDYLISCFDSKEPSFRKSLYPEYKANRGEMPEDLEEQVPYLKTMMDRLLIPYWEKSGFEADDLIASLVSFAKGRNLKTYIVSSDKDFAQIVDFEVYLYDTMKEIIYDSAGVEGKWGLPPFQMRDYLSLVGDSSDNIPGVKGIGPKGAIQLLKTYEHLEGIYSNIEKIKGSLKEKLLRDREMAFLSRKLVSLKQDIIWNKNLTDLEYQKVSSFSQKDKKALKEFLEELNFKSFIKNFFPVKTESPKPPKNLWEDSERILQEDSRNNLEENLKRTGIKIKEDLKKSFEQTKGKSSKENFKHNSSKNFGKNSNFALDLSLKTSSKYPVLRAKQLSIEEFKNTLPPYALVGIGSYKDRFYLVSGKNFTLLSTLELKALSDFLDYKWVRYSGHDLKFFWKKMDLKNPIAEWDSMIAGHLLISRSAPSLRSLCKIYLDIPEEETLSLPQLLYQEQKLKEELVSHLKHQELSVLFQDIELPLIAVLYDMERQGILLDLQEIKKQSQNLDKDIQNLEFQIHKMAGEEFNLSSPKQLAVILFEKLKLPRGRKTKTGYSTDSSELLKMKKLHPILPLLLEHRELFKLKSTYTDSLISLRDNKTGRIYTEFKQTVTATGRLSSVNPNLQNIPIRTERGRLIRKAFVAGEGKSFISADYSQLELRILAHITGDPNLCKAFEEGLDIHASTASEIFNISLKEVSSDLRRKSKAVNFGIAYGQGVYGLAENLSIPRAEAKEIIESYFKKFKKIRDYIESVKEELPKTNCVKTLYGRKRFFNPEDLKHPRQRALVERAAINAPLQGTASDLVKKAMINLNESLPIPILSQVHDELLFECPSEYSKRESKEILSIMEKNDILKVPLKVNLAVGENWFTAHS